MVELINGRWLFNKRTFHELNAVDKRMFAILIKVEMIIAQVK
jgi:hypothetical protein